MSITRIFLIRHGETEYNRKNLMQGRNIDAPLNETGRTQVKWISDYLSNYKISTLVSSSMLRARQSAELLERRFDLKLHIEQDLDEMNFGDFEGKEFDSIRDEVESVHLKWKEGLTEYPMPGGESPREVLDRAKPVAERYIRENSGGSVVFMIHGRLIRILVSEWTGMGLKQMHNVHHQNGAIFQLAWDGENFEKVYLNKTDHLTEQDSVLK